MIILPKKRNSLISDYRQTTKTTNELSIDEEKLISYLSSRVVQYKSSSIVPEDISFEDVAIVIDETIP